MCHCGKSALTGTLRFLHHLYVREHPVKGLFEVCDIFKWTSWDCSYQLKCFLLYQQSFECFPTSCKDKLCTTEGSLSDRVPTWAWNSVDLNTGSSAYCLRDSGKLYLMGYCENCEVIVQSAEFRLEHRRGPVCVVVMVMCWWQFGTGAHGGCLCVVGDHHNRV